MTTITRSQKHRARKKRRIAHLMRQQKGLCYWCEAPMTERVKHVRGKFPPTMATLDHLRDRSNPTRHIPPKGYEQRWVMACWQCNNDRGRAVELAKPIEERRARSGRSPQQQEAAQ